MNFLVKLWLSFVSIWSRSCDMRDEAKKGEEGKSEEGKKGEEGKSEEGKRE